MAEQRGVAILVGAGDAIGAAVARRFAKGGFAVCICRRDAAKSQALVDELKAAGLQAHASSEPWLGKNALDALILLFNSIGLWRQQLPRHARVHGIVLEGGTASNIIPDRAVGRFMIRSSDQAYYEAMGPRRRRTPPRRSCRSPGRPPRTSSGSADPSLRNRPGPWTGS